MGRTLRILCLAALAATTAACGGSSSSNSVASLQGGDIAVVGQQHITKTELDHQIKLEVRAKTLGAQTCTGGSQGKEKCHVKKGTIPQIGTAAYTTQIVQPVVNYLVTDAQIHNIAHDMGVTVTQSEVQAQVTKAIQQYYSGDKTKYEADLKKYELSDADVAKQFELTVLEQKIEAKLKRQVKVTDKDALDYYNSHRSVYESSAATRQVDYVLEPSKSAAQAALTKLRNGGSFKDVATGAIDDSANHEPFTATEGQIDKNFQTAAFSLKTNQLSGLVLVDQAYLKSQPSLKSRCKPNCYFVIRPTADVVKAGTKKSFASVKSQIKAQLLSSRQQAHLTKVVAQLEKAQKKLTRYAPGYAPPSSSSSSTATT